MRWLTCRTKSDSDMIRWRYNEAHLHSEMTCLLGLYYAVQSSIGWAASVQVELINFNVKWLLCARIALFGFIEVNVIFRIRLPCSITTSFLPLRDNLSLKLHGVIFSFSFALCRAILRSKIIVTDSLANFLYNSRTEKLSNFKKL